MDTSQWPQVNRLVKPMEEMISGLPTSNTSSKPLPDKRSRPQKEEALNCPRCNSTNTKFCYYNNYSLSQPRYFCKSCRRYWTDGGTLRNVPVGGGSRKNKRPSSSFSSNKKFHDLNSSSSQSPQDSQIYARKDLNMPLLEFQDSENRGNNISSSTSSNLSSFGLFKNGLSSRCVNPFMLVQNQTNIVFNPTIDVPSFKPVINFPLDGSDVGFGNIQDVEGNSDRFMFPFEDLKQVTGSDFRQNRGNGDSSGFWNGMLGGGSW